MIPGKYRLLVRLYVRKRQHLVVANRQDEISYRNLKKLHYWSFSSPDTKTRFSLRPHSSSTRVLGMKGHPGDYLEGEKQRARPLRGNLRGTLKNRTIDTHGHFESFQVPLTDGEEKGWGKVGAGL